MSERSIFAVGDIHGHHWKLVTLLAKLPLDTDDLVVFVGDYIDRGPESAQVIDTLIEFQESFKNCIFLRGNHEQMMIDARDALLNTPADYDPYALWISNGGSETLDSYPRGNPWWRRVSDTHWAFYEGTALEYQIGPFAFVHAGYLPPGAPWPHEEDPRMWVRKPFLESEHDFGFKVVFGHTPQRSLKPLVMSNKLGIDTAAGYGGPITAVRLRESDRDEFELFQA